MAGPVAVSDLVEVVGVLTATKAGSVRTGRVRARRPACRPRAARWRGTRCGRPWAVVQRLGSCTRGARPADPADPAGAERQCFTYDRRGQLTTARTASATGDVGPACAAGTRGWDWRAGHAPHSSAYTFDALHRMVTATLLRAVTTGTGSGTGSGSSGGRTSPRRWPTRTLRVG